VETRGGEPPGSLKSASICHHSSDGGSGIRRPPLEKIGSPCLIVAGFDALERTDLTVRRPSVGSSGNLTGMRRRGDYLMVGQCYGPRSVRRRRSALIDAAEKTDVAEEFRLLDFFGRNGACRGVADLFFMGRGARAERLGDFVAILRVFPEGEGPAFTRIVVVLAPGSAIEPESAAIRGCFGESLSRLLKKPLAPEEIDKAFRNVRVVPAATLQGDSIRDLVGAARPKTVFVIADAALYRAEGVDVPSYRPSLQEDFWSPHLYAVACLIHEASNASKSYVVLDAGEDMPERPENRDLLCAIKGAVTNAERRGCVYRKPNPS
jgi:hypothetical protein